MADDVTIPDTVTFNPVSTLTSITFDAMEDLKKALEKIIGYFSGSFYLSDAQEGVAVLNTYGFTFTL